MFQIVSLLVYVYLIRLIFYRVICDSVFLELLKKAQKAQNTHSTLIPSISDKCEFAICFVYALIISSK